MTTSTINTTAGYINVNFPVQGQDNPSQTFRDNYVNIVNNFSAAATDIGNLYVAVNSILGSNVADISALANTVASYSSSIATLQGNVVAIDSTLTKAVYVDTTNQMNGNVIAGATGSVVTGLTSPVGTLTINYAAGDFQVASATTNPTTIVFQNLPVTGVYAKLNLLVNITSGNSLVFPPQVTLGNAAHGIGTVGNIANVQSRIGEILTVSSTGNYWFEFATVDSGTTILATEKSHP